MRIVFAGTPAVALPSLEAVAARHEVVAVVTREDAPLGRKRVLTPSPVAEAAERLGLPVIKANRLGDDVTERIAALQPDLGVVVAYGGLVREPLLSLPRLGWVNLHFSLLPRWRGAAPVQRAVIAGDTETGAAVFHLVPELDAGDVYAELRRPIGPDETAGELLSALAEEGAALLADTADALAAGTAAATPQEGEVTLAPKLTLEDARLDLTEPAERVSARLRGVTPEPGAFVLLDGERFKVHEARTTDGEEPVAPGAVELRGKRVLVGTGTAPLELVTVQPAGKRAMPAADWLRGVASASASSAAGSTGVVFA
ncbi:methionyl-tRNA formyltransferase [Leifsonia sp. 98AMF]|uniref:methionyl-tRNA formyltransferase n=1 Tax=unclassified Leifsonia TaxID=2663824 RepID=UPI00087BD776|nr:MULTISPECIES: methionyl-tRNA formyltransferase [unclassified Leifsonia]SDH39163.1 methionyl-tRNA formyltransferase [Leifsonia sp. 197AMF]SDI97171.1 methionyl-tRNA formyltransferase [Leifsonia sp. 466MF]SDJ78384.1 methionyl-tRNA formyltransferase [Leifsonia sp. 157MF]SDO00485.1 methionyl-tRNA formyltransferase [Leifsonia sp. 509MF]SEN03658.1 methionyl-tRNA formyltransferase [Leifsonia sp. 467MF]